MRGKRGRKEEYFYFYLAKIRLLGTLRLPVLKLPVVTEFLFNSVLLWVWYPEVTACDNNKNRVDGLWKPH